jgi:hypothetical protein
MVTTVARQHRVLHLARLSTVGRARMAHELGDALLALRGSGGIVETHSAMVGLSGIEPDVHLLPRKRRVESASRPGCLSFRLSGRHRRRSERRFTS